MKKLETKKHRQTLDKMAERPKKKNWKKLDNGDPELTFLETNGRGLDIGLLQLFPFMWFRFVASCL